MKQPEEQPLPPEQAHTTAAPVGVPLDVHKRLDPFAEVGRSGLNQQSGYIQETVLRELQGQNGMKRLREMHDHWSLINGIVKMIKLTLRAVPARVEPFEGGKSVEDKDNAEFVEQCMDDMSHSWANFRTEQLSKVVFGFAPHELVYKRRDGMDKATPGERSRYSDGRIGWRKMALRGQETVVRWLFDEHGGVQGLEQQAPPDFALISIPIEKLLLFRSESHKGNPEGASYISGAWWDWYWYKKLTELAAIRVERDATGIPVMEVPAEVMASTANTAQQAVKTQAERIVKNLRQHEQAGVVLPQRYDPETKLPLFKLSLLGSPGQTQADVNALINRTMQGAAYALLADFFLLGHEKSGSWALAEGMETLFAAALNALLDDEADVLNRHGLPRLWALNGLPMERMPRINHGAVMAKDVVKIAQFLKELSAAGMTVFPHEELEDAIFEMADLPKPVHDEQDTGITMPNREEEPEDDGGAPHEGEPAEPENGGPPDEDEGNAAPARKVRKSPPWDIVERDGKFLVVVSETGEVVGRHDTRAGAERHRDALYANTEE